VSAELLGAAVLLVGAGLLAAEPLPEIPGLTLAEATIPSSVDGAEQPVVIGVPDDYDPGEPTPLLVGLHTWSADYRQRVEPYGGEAAARGWLMVLPHFRGPNKPSNPNVTQAGGSLLAQHDIIDAVEHMAQAYNVDRDRIYLTGDSGGGHMTLLMAGKYPDLWAAVAAWVPVTDLREWWEVQNAYAADVEAITGGRPGESPEIDFEYLRRSPRTFMPNLAHLPVLLAHGDRDPVIPVEQSWRTFRALDAVPAHGTVLHVFSGGHMSRAAYGLDWCARYVRSAAPPAEMHLVTDESKSYYWADLLVADETRLARADIVLGEGAMSVATENLRALTLDLNDLPLPEDGLFLGVRNAGELRLTLRGAPEAARAVCEGDWARPVEGEAGQIVLTVAPAQEARSLRLAW